MVSVVKTVPGMGSVPRCLAVLLGLALGGLPGTTLRAADAPAAAPGLRCVSLQLPWMHRMQFAGFYMAKELGYYREAGLDVEILERDLDTSPVDQVVMGQAEFGVSSLAMEGCLHGMPLVALAALSQHSPFVLLVPEHAGIRGVEDLVGRTIRIANASLLFELEAMLAAVGIAPGEVALASLPQAVDLTGGNRGEAFFCHRGGLPVELEQRGIPFAMVHPRDYGVDNYGEILFTSRNLAQREPGLARAFREASLRGWIYVVHHMDEAVARVQAGYAKGAGRERLDHEARIVRDLVADGTTPIGFIDPHRWQDCMQVLARLRRLPLDKQFSDAVLFDTFITARAARGLRILKAALGGTLLAVLLLGGVAFVLVRIVRHRTGEIARANLAIRHENEALKRAETMLKGEHDLALALMEVKTEKECLEQVVAACLRFPGVDGCGVLRPVPEGRLLRMQVCRGMGPEAAASHAELPFDSPCGAGLARGEPCRLEAGVIGDAFPALQRDGWRAIVLHPVRAGHELVAVLCLGSRRDGADNWVAVSGPVATLLGNTLRRIGSERAVRDSEALLRSAADGSIDGISLLDTDGRFLHVNAPFAAMCGCPAADMVGQHFIRFVPPEARERLRRRFENRVQGKPEENKYEASLLQVDGTIKPVLLAVKKVVWYGRTVFTVVYRDLSELKRLEQELLRIAEWEQIRIGQDLHDTIGQQLAGMAYLIEVLARNLDREKSAYAGEARELATAADTAHQQLREVVQSLLPLPEREGLEAGLQRLCDFTSLRQGATCRRSVAEPPLGREIDAVAANHLLCIAKEAIANAVRHGSARNIEVALRRQNGHGLLSIADDGCGFDVQRAQVRGSGLRIMRYRADILGGKLCLRRREDGGGMVVTCTFSLMRGSGPGDPLTAIAGRTAQNDLWSGDANGKKE